ncbi:hypothetical protein B0H34DRAFT_736447 [Crassisporium funariophilum]|nr:hypothetical protein B0H34DRAFT_736447 [Crassisporium funariophilum]
MWMKSSGLQAFPSFHAQRSPRPELKHPMFLPTHDVHVDSYPELLWYLSSKPSTKSKDVEPYLSPKDSFVKPIITRPSATPSNTKPRLFALIIGINFYENVRSLRGAVPDALAFKEYLETNLNVPTSHIHTLLNRAASRSAIIESFIRLKEDSRIDKDDPILIFYAGHGSEVPAPLGWESGSDSAKIQLLVPQDYCSAKGREIPGIPDRTIGALLNNIAEVKGNNITVVFDCCHSGSGTRKDDERGIRSVELDLNITGNLDQNIWGHGTNRSASIPAKFTHSGLRSHVLLAACSSSEFAREEKGRGNFSTALLKLLRTVGPEQLRYFDILSRLDAIPSQNPQCEGVYQNRYLFNAMVSGSRYISYPVREENSQFILDAGAAHGITEGAEFTVYSQIEKAEPPLGILTVETVDSFSSTMRPVSIDQIFSLPTTAVGIQTKAGEKESLRIYAPLDDQLLPFFEALALLQVKGTQSDHKFSLVETSEDAHLGISIHNNRVVFEILDERISGHGLSRLFHDVNPSVYDIVAILKGAAHFFWELDRGKPNSEITSDIRIDFYRLQESENNFDEAGNVVYLPTGQNLCENNVLDFTVEEDLIYGLKLTNHSSYDLYPTILYFDNSDLSIGPYYAPQSSGQFTLDVPLKKEGGTLTVGYGLGGSPPFSYYLREGQDIDVGFLKVYASTKPVDLFMVPQQSPFETMHSRSGRPSKKEPIDVWGTLLIPVVQRRRSEKCVVSTGAVITGDLETENSLLRSELNILHQSSSIEKKRFQAEANELRITLQHQRQEIDVLTNSLASERDERINLQSELDAMRSPPQLSVHKGAFRSAEKERARRKPTLFNGILKLLGHLRLLPHRA